ncbi:unnamed protein product [Blepharisma stoltei]|uniref:RCC1-like domain-containing protein n=1 Tax=Blepharisma stoltei TaxID=1481888 RepID=A0AAU9J382_9CILI|nr:unnamed protein product [Blepharisma stoltei]
MEGYTEVFSWGNDNSGQLGLGSHTTGKTYCSPRFCTFNVLISQVSCGEEHAAFVSRTGYLYTMGSNLNGRLGIGDKTTTQSSSPCLVDKLSGYRTISVSCGGGHSAAVVEGGLVFSWGSGDFGALGLGDTQCRWTPENVTLNEGFKALQVSCGSRHTGIICENNRNKSLFMWGAGDSGQLGTGKRENELLPAFINLIDAPKQVACGLYHSIVVTVSGFVLAMGGNAFGQLGIGNKKSSSIPIRVNGLDRERIAKVACGYHSAAISETGELYVWGTGIFGECLAPKLLNELPEIKDLTLGGTFGAVLDKAGNIWTWGSNSNGELGIGDYERRATINRLNILAGRQVSLVSCGGNFALALGQDIYGEQVKSPRKSPILVAKGQDRAQSVKRYISPPKISGPKTPSKYTSKLESARSSASKVYTKKENSFIDDSHTDATKSRNIKREAKKHEDLESSYIKKEEYEHKKKDQESTERHQCGVKIRELEGELSDMRIALQRVNDTSKYQNEIHSKEIQRFKIIAEEKEKEAKDIKQSLELKRNSDAKIIEKLENRLKDIENLREQEIRSRVKLEAELQKLEEKYAYEIKLKDQEIRKLLTNKENDQITLEETIKQKEKLAELLRSEVRKNSKPAENAADTEDLIKRCDQIEKSMTLLTEQCENYQNKIASQDKAIIEFKQKIQNLEKENCKLKMDLNEAESKNKQLFTNLEKDLRERAKEYKERTLNLLSTPMGARMSDRYNGASPDTTLPLESPNISMEIDRKIFNNSIEPTVTVSPVHKTKCENYLSPRLQMKHAQLQEHQTPPTFREGGGVLKNSLAEIRLRLNLLQDNKTELENKLSGFRI